MVVYRVTNQVNGKVYIGKWQGKNVQTRWEHHCRLAASGKGFYLHNAIRKYGSEAFTVEVIATAPTKEELAALECSLIASHRSTDPQIGYNIAKGGEGGFSYPGERNPFYGRHHSEETKAVLREKCPRVGWQHSEESRKKIARAHEGKQFSDEHCLHISEAKKGHSVSAEQRQKASEWASTVERTPQWCARIGAALRDKPKSAEHRQKLSESKRAPIVDRTCPICETVFQVPDKLHSKKCCSRKCSRKLGQDTIGQRSEIAKAMWAGRV